MLANIAKSILRAPDAVIGGPTSGLPKPENVPLNVATLTRLNPENPQHIELAHQLDDASAWAGLFNETNEPELLSPEEFGRWTHAGDKPSNLWKRLFLVSDSAGENKGFANSYRLETIHKTELATKGLIKPSHHGEEMEVFLPGDGETLTESTYDQLAAERLGSGKVDFLTAWPDSETKIQALTNLGFKEAYTGPYAEGDTDLSTCYVLTKAEYAQASLQKMATG